MVMKEVERSNLQKKKKLCQTYKDACCLKHWLENLAQKCSSS